MTAPAATTITIPYELPGPLTAIQADQVQGWLKFTLASRRYLSMNGGGWLPSPMTSINLFDASGARVPADPLAEMDEYAVSPSVWFGTLEPGTYYIAIGGTTPVGDDFLVTSNPSNVPSSQYQFDTLFQISDGPVPPSVPSLVGSGGIDIDVTDNFDGPDRGIDGRMPDLQGGVQGVSWGGYATEWTTSPPSGRWVAAPVSPPYGTNWSDYLFTDAIIKDGELVFIPPELGDW